MKKKIFYFLVLMCLSTICSAQIKLRGRVLSAGDNKPLAGATINLKGTGNKVAADSAGYFRINVPGGALLSVSFLGYQSEEVQVPLDVKADLIIKLELSANNLEEIIVSTGYQEVPKERATGSFIKLNNELLNRRVSSDIISRLEDITPGLVFNHVGNNKISIRGQSTIHANAQPLIVLDNFAYEGDVNSINPNDVESITILKDAAAASIWGARAGNGVIVITTKTSKYQSPLRIAFNTNYSVSGKPDLFYQPQMTISDYIETEKLLFSKGFYKSSETSVNKTPLSPVIELLIARRDGRIDASAADQQIEDLKSYDLRNDVSRYLYRQGQNQQFALNLTGGSPNQKYYVSAGYDKSLASAIGQDNNRITLNANQTYALANQKLELSTGIYLTEGIRHDNNPGIPRMSSALPLYPYARLVDDNGVPLSIIHDYRSQFILDARANGLLNWELKPLEELDLRDNSSDDNEYRLNAGLKYRLIEGLHAGIMFQYSRRNGNSRNIGSADSYFARDLINTYTIVNTDGTLTRPIPAGGILDQASSSTTSRSLRASLSYNKTMDKRHHISSIAGWEIRILNTMSDNHRSYGYDNEHAASSPVDYITLFKRYTNPASTQTIPNTDYETALSDRFISYYANGAYTYDNRYIVSASARLDQSNLFGVKSNQKGVPLWSAGFAWNLSDEKFYYAAWLPYLRMRLTYGHTGNIDKSLSSFTTASFSRTVAAQTRLPYATIQNPPNPELRWERVKIWNAGLDFSTLGNKLSGSLELYSKAGFDLIGDTRFPPSSGIINFRGNTANTRGKGVDFTLGTVNIDRTVKWNTDLLFSWNKEEVSKYLVKSGTSNYLQFGVGGGVPLEGRPLYSIYSYGWNGLDPQTGNPLGYLNNVPSMDYARIISTSTPETINFNGSSKPLFFGAIRNTWSYRSLSASLNITYRLGYYFRKNSVSYGNTNGLGTHGDYSKRWQKPGDELITNVPSIPVSGNSSRDNFYLYSDVLVGKGDHIRIQDVNITYDLAKLKIRGVKLQQAQVYCYANNLGLLWKANQAGTDPDYQAGPPPLSLSAGFKMSF